MIVVLSMVGGDNLNVQYYFVVSSVFGKLLVAYFGWGIESCY